MMKIIAFLCPLAMLPLGSIAQDDMYFVPTKSTAEPMADHQAHYYAPEPMCPGSTRDVDEYNRMSSYVTPLDSVHIDVIDFDGAAGEYPDSLAPAPDYVCTRAMSRFDGYNWTDPYMDGYLDGRYDYWYYDSPWRYTAWGYYGHYWPWSYYYGWYSPWYYGSWWYPHYHHHHWGVVRPTSGGRWVTGTRHHSRGGNFGRASSADGSSRGLRGIQSRQSRSRSTGSLRSSQSRPSYNSNRSTYTPSHSGSSFRSSGGSRGGGSFGGGSRGGGSFRGRR